MARPVHLIDFVSQERIPVAYESGEDGFFDQRMALASGENHLGSIGGIGATISSTFSRPANTTQYALNDVVGPAVTALSEFPNVARKDGGSSYIVKALLITNQPTCVAGFRLFLFSDNTPAPIADNEPFALLWANRSVFLGVIDFDSMATEGTGSDSAFSINQTVRLHLDTKELSRNIYGVLVTKTAFTPISGQSFYISLSAEQD